MSREDRIFSKLEFIEYVYQKYPNILTEWKNKIAGVDETPAAHSRLKIDYTVD
jgi:hypothetical protein